MPPHKNGPHLIERVTRWVGSVQSLVVHTIFFVASFSVAFLGFVRLDLVLLVLTTVLSLEAIYLAIFIQMTVNRNTESLEEVEEDVAEIQEDMGEVQEDVAEIQGDIDEVQEDVAEIQEDIDEVQEDIDELSEEEKEELKVAQHETALKHISETLQRLISEVESLKK